MQSRTFVKRVTTKWVAGGYFGKTHLTRCTGEKREDMQDNNKNKIDHIPLCLMINLPKIEIIKPDSKTYSAKDMNMSFQNEDWRAKWFDHQYSEQVKEIDFKEALEQQGDVHFAYGQLEFIMQELATELWPVTKDKKEKKNTKTLRNLLNHVKLLNICGGLNGRTKDWRP